MAHSERCPMQPSLLCGVHRRRYLSSPGLRAENILRLDPPHVPRRSTPSQHLDRQSHDCQRALRSSRTTWLCCMIGPSTLFLASLPTRFTTCIRVRWTPRLVARPSASLTFQRAGPRTDPGFREALDAAQVAEFEPGDVLFYPAMWWHHVEALGSFNAMINYWWIPSPCFHGFNADTLLHTLLSIRDRPEQENRPGGKCSTTTCSEPGEAAGEHLPEHARGNLGAHG